MQDVERGRGHWGVRERNAKRELVGTGGGGRRDVVEFRREDVAEDAVDFGAIRLDGGDDDGEAGVGLLGEASAQPAGAGGEFGLLVGSGSEGAAGRGRRLIELLDGRAGGLDCVEEGCLRRSSGVESDEQESGSKSEVAGGDSGAEGFGKLCLGEVAGSGAAAFELAGPAGEGAGVGAAWVVLEAAATAVGVQQ